jgi:hypothetical protein
MSPRSERREFPRYPADPQTRCDLTLSGVIGFPVLAVLDLSVSGLQLLVDMPVPAGTVLRVQLHNPARQLTCTRAIRVAYTRPAPGADYLLGAFFGQGLSVAELEGLRAPDRLEPPLLAFIWDPGVGDLCAFAE